MIRLRVTSGPHRGQSRTFVGYDDGFALLDGGEAVNIRDLMGSIVKHGWSWEVDYSQADEAETIGWGVHDVTARISRAFLEKRPLYFRREKYEDHRALEDAIMASGQMVSISRDDESGLWVEAYGPEPPEFNQ